MGFTIGFKGEFGAEKLWGPRWKYHFARTVYYLADLYLMVTNCAERSQEYYNGVPFALANAWKHFDLLTKE